MTIRQPNKRTHSNKAFALTDMLVVIAIIGILIALLLPAVQAAREAARRASCSVKMKNVTTALHIYHDSQQHLPSSAFYKDGQNMADKDIQLKTVVPGEGGEAATRAPYSLLVKLLPFIEQGYIFDRIDFTKSEAFDAANQVLASKVVPVYVCPSYDGPPRTAAADYNAFAGGKETPALTQYKTMGATTLACLQDSASVTSAELNGGTMHPYAAYSFNAVKAPTQTIFLVETREPRYSAWWDGTTIAIPGFHPGIGNEKDDREPTPPKGEPALNVMTSGQQKAFMTTDQFAGKEDMQWGPSSEHPGLVIHSFGSTEIRAISNDIDPVVYRAMISRRADDNADIGDYLR